ncbi:MAG: protein kinase [Deltaproteobacteria bacterium]|nr:protein kinase [Deltaproteobacteria bacterium]
MNEGELGRFVGDRYHIVRELGRGGMGVVYLGHDTRRDMDVAIKLRGIHHIDATLWLKREFRAVASLRHPNLVELYELVAHDRSCYFTMEYLRGIDPRRYVEHHSTRTALPLEEAHTAASDGPALRPPTSVFSRPVPVVDFARIRSVLTQLAEGLAFLHARGVIHRDIKPSNAIVVDGVVKLLDFGLALERRRQDDEVARETRLVGTAAYLSPEYLADLVIGPEMDVYALGVLAFELCTGAPPFGGTLHLLTRMSKSVRLPRVSETNPDIPADLDDLILAMLAQDPAERPTAFEIETQLTGNQSHPRARREVRFIGRGAELVQIATRIADPSPRGRLVLITGPSGAGKTALIDEAVGRARNPDTLIWRGRCHERERVPYRAFDLIVDDLATELAGDPRLAKQIDHATALASVFPVLAPLLSARDDEPAATDLRVERERALLALSQMFALLITGARAVIVIDDLQWADEDSLELLAVLVERIGRPLTVIGTWTTHAAGNTPEPLLARLGAAAEAHDVPAMSSLDLQLLIAELAPSVPLARIAAAAELSAGSPYLAELIGRELGDTNVGDVHDAERRRLDRLSVHERTVARIAALAGGPTSFEQLKALAELPSERLQSVLRGLEDAKIVRATPATTGEPVYVFYHQRLRETATAAITDADRRALHEKFATWFEGSTTPDPAQLAYHWFGAGERPRAAHWAIAAGDAARAQLAWVLAADWYARALEHGAEATIRERLAECLFLGGKLSAAATEFLALARTGDAPDLRHLDRATSQDVSVPWGRSRSTLLSLLSGRRTPSVIAHESIGRAGGGDRWRVRAAEAYLKLGELERGLNVLDEVLAGRGAPRTKHRAVSIARAVVVTARWLTPVRLRTRAADDVLPGAYRVIASFLSTPYPIESLEYVMRGVALAEHSGDRAAYAMGMAMLSAYVATGSLGRFGDRAIANAHRLATQSGAPYPAMVASGAAGMLATLRGNWAGMRTAHQDAERVCKRLGLERSWEASFLRTYWALGEHYAGEPARALELLGPLTETSDDLWTRAMLGSCRGRALVVAGDLEAARGVARELDRAPAALQGMSSIYRLVFLGELALAEHDWPRAAAIAKDLVTSARSQWLSTMPAISAMIDVIAATAAIGERRATRALAIARRLYRRGDSSFYAVTGLRLWAQAAHMLGDRDQTRDVLARATVAASDRGGNVDRLAIRALGGGAITPGPLGAAVTWSTGGMIDGEHGWQLRYS